MDILGTRKLWFWISGIFMALSVGAMVFFGFTPGIDFAGGSILELEVTGVQDQSTEQVINSAYQEVVGEEPVIQPIGENRFSMRTKTVTDDQRSQLLATIGESAESVTELSFQSISPAISFDILRRAVLGVLVAIVAIMFFIAYAFRTVPDPLSSWRFGMASIAALVHDVVILLGIYAALGYFFGAEVDSMFVVAILTLLGFSVNDTIVTFDRVRENVKKRPKDDLEEVMNDSVVDTIPRSINTSFTLLLVLLAMVFFGDSTILFFTLALAIGVFIGTYSSIFIATPLLLDWHKEIWAEAKE